MTKLSQEIHFDYYFFYFYLNAFFMKALFSLRKETILVRITNPVAYKEKEKSKKRLDQNDQINLQARIAKRYSIKRLLEY